MVARRCIDHRTVGADYGDFQRHLPQRMGGAGEAGVEGADGDLDVVEQAFGDLDAVEVLLGHFAHRRVHRLVVVRGGDDQVGADHLVVFVDAVVVDQRAARRFDDADAAFLALAGGHQVVADDVVVVQQVLDGLGRMQHFDHARPVVAERGAGGAAAVEGHELLARLVRQRGRDAVAHA
jgi:hypothetical protein